MYKKLYTFLNFKLHCKDMKNSLQILGLSVSAATVLLQIKAGRVTPVQIAKHINLSRPAIYAILRNLQTQGLVTETYDGDTKVWTVAHISQINSLFEAAKEGLFGSSTENAVKYLDNGLQVNVYRGKETIGELMKEIFTSHRGQKCIGIQGVNVYPGWKSLLGVEFVNKLNKAIKKNKMINQAIVPRGHFDEVVKVMGVEWARHFEGRPYRANEIDPKYFKHKGEMFFFKDSVYLVSMSENLVIEIKHSHIHQMLYGLIEYVQENSPVVDGNERLRQIIASA